MKTENIKFRGYSLEQKKWFYGNYALVDEVHWIIPFEGGESEAMDDWARVEVESVGQWTCLKDKDGMEIYDGDCVLYNDTPYIVEYIPQKAAFSLRGIERFTDIMAEINNNSFTELFTVKYFKVVGDVYLDPRIIEIWKEALSPKDKSKN